MRYGYRHCNEAVLKFFRFIFFCPWKDDVHHLIKTGKRWGLQNDRFNGPWLFCMNPLELEENKSCSISTVCGIASLQ
jgi:hypothetical protein